MADVFNPTYAPLMAFATRLRAGDARALNGLKKLHVRAMNGDPLAAALIRKIASAVRSDASVGWTAIGMSAASVKHASSKVFGATGRLLERTGHVIAKPFHFVEGKLAGAHPGVHVLPAHFHTPR